MLFWAPERISDYLEEKEEDALGKCIECGHSPSNFQLLFM